MPEDANAGGPLRPEEYAALGRITANTSDLEYAIVEFIGRMLDDMRLALAITAGAGARSLLQLWQSIFTTQFEKHRHSDDVIALISSIRTIEDRRNQIVHSWWAVDSATGKARRQRVKRHKKQPFVIDDELFGEQELNEFADIVNMAARAVRLLGRRLR